MMTTFRPISVSTKSQAVFDKVDWEAHRLAYTSYKKTQRISTSKLVHGLYHTKYEANKLYGDDALCPCCGRHLETLGHMFSCQAESSAKHREEAKRKLRWLKSNKNSRKAYPSITPQC
jgi:hypothetical protein